MILLTTASDLLQMVASSATPQMDVHASWIDFDSGAVTPGRGNLNVTATGPTTIVPSPASGQRNVKALTIRNTHATLSNTITIEHFDNDSSLTSTLFKYTMLPGETIQYFDSIGFEVLDASGGRKVTPATGLFLKRTIYTSGTNTFVPMAQTHTLMVYVQGGGGGGGASGTGNAGNDNAGGGGGSGGYTHRKYAVSAAATYTAVVGGGGPGGVAASNNGTTGTLSSFTDGSTQINGTGGLGGVFGPAIAAAPLVAPGGAGGAANANGDFNSAGSPGGPGMRLAAALAVAGDGSSSHFGGGGVGALNGRATGTAGGNYGSGGAGGEGNSSGGQAGGAGAAGIVVVDEFS